MSGSYGKSGISIEESFEGGFLSWISVHFGPVLNDLERTQNYINGIS
jgi:hypothetical protein